MAKTGYLISGRINLTVEDKKLEAKPGDSWCIGGNIQHSADVIEDSVIIEVFAPVRDEYLA